MQTKLIAVSLVLVASLITFAGTSLSNEVYKVIGQVLEFDRAGGVMVISEEKDANDKAPANKISVIDNDRRILQKKKALRAGVNVNLDYEKSGDKNAVRSFFIVPGGC